MSRSRTSTAEPGKSSVTARLHFDAVGSFGTIARDAEAAIADLEPDFDRVTLCVGTLSL
jgi:hypothetical protein